MVPETWVPTCTVVTACSAPVAPTVSARSPRVTRAVLIVGGDRLLRVAVVGVAAAGEDGQNDGDE